MKLNSIALAAVLALGVAVPAGAVEREENFTYVREDAQFSDWGTKKLENYDIAIHLDDPGLAGTKIVGFTCPIAAVQNISGLTGWVSPELVLNEEEVNVPQLIGNTVLDAEAKTFTVTFETPYEITRDGAFVGFSFNVDELTEETMLPLSMASGTDAEGFWIHSSRTYRKWRTMEHRKMVVPINVMLAGEFSDYCVAISNFTGKSVAADTDFEVTVNLTNFGTEAVTSIDYAYNTGEAASTGSVELSEPIEARFGARGSVVLPIGAIEDWGIVPLEITITGVNGQPNESKNATATAEMTVIGFVPETRPLMEEYTGLWCGFCPRGYIGLERMSALYGDRFVAISLHASQRDPMQVITQFPQNPGGFPAAFLNRKYLVDPYYGSSSDVELGIKDDWEYLSELTADADISVTCDWKDDSKTELVCRSMLRFPNAHSGEDYKLVYAIVADGLTEVAGRVFEQANYFSGDRYVSGEDWDVFVNGDQYVKGLVFNDILVAFNDVWGVAGSVPSEIEYGREYVHRYTYTAPFKNIYAEEVVSDYSKVRCIAILLKGNEFVNCATSGYPGTSGISDITADSDSDAEVIASDYFDIEGRRIFNPGEGKFYIRVDHLSDGTTRPVKVVR